MSSSSPNTGKPAPIPVWLVIVGGVPLLAAMGIEFVGVILRNAGLPIPGTIEIVQACVLLSSSVAIVIATLGRAHAKVHVLLNRARGTPSRLLRMINAIGGVVFFTALVVGSAWIALDMWGGAEHSEMLGIPWLPLRLYIVVTMLATAVLYALRLARRGDGE